MKSARGYVKRRLEAWAYFFTMQYHSLGYPSVSSGAFLREAYYIKNKQKKGEKRLPCNEEAEEIEYWVSKMSERHFLMAKVVRCHYFNEGNRRQKARALKISERRFEAYLELAYEWLEKKLI